MLSVAGLKIFEMTTQILLSHQKSVKYNGWNLVRNILQVTLIELMADMTRG